MIPGLPMSLPGHPDGRRISPAAARNLGPILAVLRGVAPQSGRALEIASGPGQHLAEIAQALPGLQWQPTDLDPGHFESIAAWTARAGLTRVAPPLRLDACVPGWAAEHGPVDLILVVNLLHLVTIDQAVVLLSEAAQALAPGGLIAIYGPFLRNGQTVSEADARFDAQLRASGRDIGYKDLLDVQEAMSALGLIPQPAVAMPANNLFLLARKAGVTAS